MLYAVLADIHSNWEALERSLAYLKERKVHHFWILGDTIGYGANPNECFAWAIQNTHVQLLGNHEKAVVEPSLLEHFNEDARKAAEWTTQVLKPEYHQKIRELPYLHIVTSATLVHGSPHEPRAFHYIFSPQDAWAAFNCFETALCFVGHTHVPSLFRESSDQVKYLDPGIYEIERNEHFILNPGSVGQPRDGDWRLSFGIFDDKAWTFEIVRLEYNNKKAAQKIRDAGLPSYLADRLL